MKNLYFFIIFLLLFTGSVTAQDQLTEINGLQGTLEESCNGNLRQLVSGGYGRVADIDNDGFGELLSWSTVSSGLEENSINWYVYQYNPAKNRYEVEYLSEVINGRVTHVSLIDLDSDGTIEIVMEFESKGVQVYDGITKEKKFSFKVPYPMYSSSRNIQRILKADADNDGITEILMTSGDHCWLYIPSENGITIKSDFPIGGNDVRAGNIDDNPDIELVFSDKVVRITGNNLEQLWTIPDAWGYGRSELIDIDADGKKEILHKEWSLTAWNGDTHDTIYQIYIGSSNFFVKDIDGDGQEEIFHDANSRINCINSSTGEKIWEFFNPGEIASNAGISDLDNDGELEIYWVGEATFSGTVIYVYDLATKSEEWKSIDTDGPFSRVRVADVDNDDLPELITLALQSESGYGEPVMTIFDAATNNLEWQTQTDYFNYANEMHDFIAADIDNDDTTEIIAVSTWGRFYVINAITRKLEKTKGFSSISNLYSLVIADADNDGSVEIVCCENQSVIIIDPLTWTIEWQSSDFTNYGDNIYSIDVGNIDSDEAPEIIYLHNNVLTVFDGITHESIEISQTDIASFCLFDQYNNGVSAIYFGTTDGKVGVISANTVSWTSISTGHRINDLKVVDLLEAPGEEYLFMSGGKLWTSTADGKDQKSQVLSKTDSKYDCIEVSDYNADGRKEIFIGTTFMVTELGFDCYKCAAVDVNLQVSHVTCGHGNDGQIFSLVDNAIAPINYSWNNGMTSQNLTNLEPGIYTLTATDVAGCADIDSVEVEQLYLQAFIHATRKGCTSEFPGEIVTGIVKGTPPYSYLWNNGSTESSLNNPPEGHYTVLITDGNNCTRELSAPMIKDTLIINDKITPANCHNGGSIEISASGYPPYIFTWSDGTNSVVKNEPDPGNYTITVRDNYGCNATREIVFEPYIELGANVTAIADNPNTPEFDGAIILEPFGGSPPYTIQWSIYPEPVNPLIVTGLKPDEYYSYYISDAANCQYSGYVEITNSVLFREAKLYPNPVRDIVSIDISANVIAYQKATADFYNIHGRKELSVDLTSPITTVDLTTLGSGLYLVKVSIDGVETFMKMERIKHKDKD